MQHVHTADKICPEAHGIKILCPNSNPVTNPMCRARHTANSLEHWGICTGDRHLCSAAHMNRPLSSPPPIPNPWSDKPRPLNNPLFHPPPSTGHFPARNEVSGITRVAQMLVFAGCTTMNSINSKPLYLQTCLEAHSKAVPILDLSPLKPFGDTPPLPCRTQMNFHTSQQLPRFWG